MRELDEDSISLTLNEYAAREIPEGYNLWAGMKHEAAAITMAPQPEHASPSSPTPQRALATAPRGASTRNVRTTRRFGFSQLMAVGGIAAMLVMLVGLWTILKLRSDVTRPGQTPSYVPGTQSDGISTPRAVAGGVIPVDALALVPKMQLLRSSVTGMASIAPDGQPLMAWSPDGKLLASSGSNVVAVAEAVSGRPLFISPFSDSGTAHALSWSPDGSMIAVGLDYDQVVVLEVATRKHLHRLTASASGGDQGAGAISPTPLQNVPPSPPIVSLSWSPDSGWLAAAPQYLFGNSTERRGEVRLWYIATGTLSRNLSLASLGPYTQVRSGPFAATRVAWSPAGRYLAAISDRDALVVWDSSNNSQVRSLQEGDFSREGQRPLDFRWSPDGSSIAVLTQYSVELWDPYSGSILRSLPDQPPGLTPGATGADGPGRLLGAAWSPRGDAIATFDEDEKGSTVRVWDVASGKQLYSRPLEIPGLNGMPLAWSPDGRVMAVTGASTELWDARSNTRLRDLDSVPPRALMWSPDGSMLAVYGEGKMEIWGDAAQAEATATVQAP